MELKENGISTTSSSLTGRAFTCMLHDLAADQFRHRNVPVVRDQQPCSLRVLRVSATSAFSIGRPNATTGELAVDAPADVDLIDSCEPSAILLNLIGLLSIGLDNRTWSAVESTCGPT
jgi:hypothetical protein